MPVVATVLGFAVVATRGDVAYPLVLIWALVKIAIYAKLHISPAPDCIPDRPAIELVRFYSLKRWWGRGVGAALMETCLRIARQEGYTTIWLSSWKINDRANAFYRKWGFREVGEKTFVVGTDVQEDFVMARPLKE